MTVKIVMILVGILSIIAGVFLFLTDRKLGNLPKKLNKPVGIIGGILGIYLIITVIFFI